MQSKTHLTLCLFAFAAIIGCNKKTEIPALPVSTLSESFYIKDAPPGAQSVASARQNTKSGDEVIVTGRVGGSAQPFVNGAAAFSIVDNSEKSCLEDGSACAVPWDYCCTDPKTLAEKGASVEFVQGEQRVGASVRGFHGVDHLKVVTVVGKAKKDEAGNLTILARGIYINP